MTNKKILTLISLLLFLFLLVGCWPKPNLPPEITSDPVKTATVGVDYTYNVVATDPNAGDVLAYSLIDEPEGMLIDEDSGKITWTSDAVGDFPVTVQVSDEDGLSDSQDFTITVSEFVVELIGIEVYPETMTLCFPGGVITKTFKVTAYYNDDTTADVTPDCVYGISNISIVEVNKDTGEVTANKVGTATISISYTEGDITKGTTLTVIVEGTITIRWLEDSVRFYPDNSIWYTFQNDPIPPEEAEPATLILIDGGYHFADANEVYNYFDLPNFEGSAVIDGTGQLIVDTTYTSTVSGLPMKEHIEGKVEIILGEEKGEVIWPEDPKDYDGIMVGTYTQWAYAFGTEEEVFSGLPGFTKGYPWAVPAPEQGLNWWFIGHTEYIAHGWKELPL